MSEVNLKNLKSLTKAELIKEIERLKGSKTAKPKVVRPKKARSERSAIRAGMVILKGDLLVVDEAKRIAYVHPEVKTVPNEIRIHGYAMRNYKKGETVRIRNWWEYEPS